MQDVLKLIKDEGPISAAQIALRFSISEKQARSAIDRLRSQGEAIWNDSARGQFWWQNDVAIGNGWKRPYSRPRGDRLLHEKAQRPILSKGSVPEIRSSQEFPMSQEAWAELVQAGRQSQWARPGIFATGVGERFKPAGRNSILYVGKSMGALGERLHLNLDQAENARKTRAWMQAWPVNNPTSAFWQFASMLGPVEELAWTNLLKIDVPTVTGKGRGRPPSPEQTKSLEDISVRALKDEINSLRPRITLFVTGAFQIQTVHKILDSLRYEAATQHVFAQGAGQSLWRSGKAYALLVRHPQGTTTEWRNGLVQLIQRLRET
jgi:hypothetical protein